MSSEKSGAAAICAALKAAGVEAVFGVPGTQTIPFYEALRKASIPAVTATHELAATFMAQGHFRASGRLAAVSAIPGPGFAFALAALPESSLDSAALVLLTGQPPVCPQGRRRSQSIDQATMAGPVVKGVFDVADARQAGQVVRRACALATDGEPGPVLVQVAANVWNAQAGTDDASGGTPVASLCQSDEEALSRAVAFVSTADRVLFYVGQGAASASGDLRRLIDAMCAIVATTPSGRGILPESDARLLPFDATGDLAAFNAIAAGCDAIVVLGAAMAENGSAGFGIEFPADRLVRVDISAAVLSAPPAARFSVRVSSAGFVDALLGALKEDGRRRQCRGFDASAARTLRARLIDRRVGGPSDARIGGQSAQAFFAALRRGLPADGCLVLDSGMHQLLARRHFVALQPRGLLFPTDFQSMAFGLPAAIGAKVAQPDRAVVALIGDGGFAMSGLELRTAARLKLSLPVIVFDDGALGLIRLDQLLSTGHAHGTEIGHLDYESMAAALNCAYARASAGDIEQQLAAALQRKGPTLIAVAVGDAPALARVRRKRVFSQALRAVLGPKLVEKLRRLRAGGRT
jgi:acetolactate synthase-1/2/3 large subunit